MEIITLLKRKNRKSPFFNQLIKLRANVQNKTKLLKFRKKKWKLTQNAYKKKFRWYQRYKINDQSLYLANKYASLGNKYAHYFRNSKAHNKNLQLFYGVSSRKNFKKQLKIFRKKKKLKLNYLEFIRLFESRLDSVIFRSKFSKSIKDSRQLILHGKILVNRKIIKSPDHLLKLGDIVSLNKNNHYLINENLSYYFANWKNYGAGIWPHPSKHLIVNYATLEILFGIIDFKSVSGGLFYYLHLDKVVNKSYYN